MHKRREIQQFVGGAAFGANYNGRLTSGRSSSGFGGVGRGWGWGGGGGDGGDRSLSGAAPSLLARRRRSAARRALLLLFIIPFVRASAAACSARSCCRCSSTPLRRHDLPPNRVSRACVSRRTTCNDNIIHYYYVL